MCKPILYMEIHKLYQTLTFLHFRESEKRCPGTAFCFSGIRAGNVAAEISSSVLSVCHFWDCRIGKITLSARPHFWALNFPSSLYLPWAAANGVRFRMRQMTWVNPYLRSVFSFSAFFVLILEKKMMAPNESKLTQAVFVHEQVLIAILPLRGQKWRRRSKRKQRFWSLNTLKQRSEHGVYHNLVQLEFNFS